MYIRPIALSVNIFHFFPTVII